MFNILFGFIAGSIGGSVATAVADRYQQPHAFVLGRSQCPHCHMTLRWFELLPIVSWLTQHGQCRSCQWPIGWAVLAVELVSGLIGLLVVARLFGTGHFEPSASNLILGFFGWCSLIGLGALTLTDLTDQQLPDRLMIGTLPFLVVLGWAIPTLHLTASSALLGSAVGGGFLGLLWLGTKGRGIGLGDVKLLAALGLAIGYPLILVALFVAFIGGGAWSGVLLATGRAKFDGQTRVAFGPFLMAGYIVALLAGRSLLAWFGLV